MTRSPKLKQSFCSVCNKKERKEVRKVHVVDEEIFLEFCASTNKKCCTSTRGYSYCSTYFKSYTDFKKHHHEKQHTKLLEEYVNLFPTKKLKRAKPCKGIECDNFEMWINNNTIYDKETDNKIGILNNNTIFSTKCEGEVNNNCHVCSSCQYLRKQLQRWTRRLNITSEKFQTEKYIQYPSILKSKVEYLEKIQKLKVEEAQSKSELLQQIVNLIDNFADNGNELDFNLIRMKDELERILTPGSTKEYPPCVKNFWKMVRFYSSKKLFSIFSGSEECNIKAPHPNTLKTWNKGLLYGHLYTEESIERLTKQFTEKNNQTSFCLISWDIVTVRSILTSVKGNVFGFEEGPKSYSEVLQLDDNIDLCGKVVVFELIDTAGQFTVPVAAFNLPTKNAQSEVLKYLLEIAQKWNRNFIEIVGSCADGEFKIDVVEKFMKQHYPEWYHVEDYVHILKRLRNPMMDNEIVSLRGIIYLATHYNTIFNLIRKSDVVIRDEMNFDAVLHLIDSKLLKELRKIKNELKTNLINDVPPISQIFEGYYMTRGDDVYTLLDAQMDFENIADIIEKSSSSEALKQNLATQIRLTRLPEYEELELVTNLYRHLKYMSLFYNLCHDEENYSLLDKIFYMKKVVRYVNSTTFISDQTKLGVASILRFWVMLKKCIDYEQEDSDTCSDISQVSSVSNVMCNCQDSKYLYDECDDDNDFHYQVMTSTISTNGLELLFSILRHKVPNMSDLELFQQLRKVIEIKHIHHISASTRVFSLPKFKISDHYARLNIEFDDIPPLPDNYVQTNIIPKDMIDNLKSKIKTINFKQDSIPLRKDTGVVGNKNDQIVCPLCQKNYGVGKNLLNHLVTKHNCSADKAKVVADCMVNSCYLTNALHQEMKRKIRLEKFKLERQQDEIVIESDSTQLSQNNNTQNTIAVTPPKKVSKSNSKIEICKCGKGRKATKSPCKSCRQCCLNNGGCTTHQFKFNLIESIEEYDVLILDFETTDLQTRAPTDCCIYNISTCQSLSFPKYILPRVKISRDAEKLTGITNELVQNGTKEMDAVKLIIDFLPKKSLILAHNAPFDKSVLYRAFNHWRINDSKITDGMKNSHLIFLDTIPILKKVLKLGKNQCKLGNIYQQLFKKSIENQHTAAADVFALKEILENVFGKEHVIRNVKNHFNLIKDLKKSFIMVDSNGKEMKDSALDKIMVRSI